MTFFDFVDHVPTRLGSYWPTVPLTRARPRRTTFIVDAIIALVLSQGVPCIEREVVVVCCRLKARKCRLYLKLAAFQRADQH